MIVPPINFNVAKMAQEKELHGCFLSETTPQSNARADEAKERILTCLQELPPDMKIFVMPGVIFDGYLSARPPKLPEATGEKVHIPFPKPADMPAQYRRGEIDVLIFDKSHGILILDTKAIGDTFEEMSVDESEKLSLIRKVLEKVLALIRKEREVILHLVSDVPCTIPVSAMLVLPNLKRSLLKIALDSYPDLRKELSSALKTKRPVEEECLCADDLPSKHRPMTDEEAKRFVRWWKRRFPDKEQTIDDNVYEQIIGRFCGPFSTVTVWTAEPPRADVRTLGRAVHETGRRFSAMVLYPEHRQILQSQERLVYISGPPGSGKTLVLVLKGLQWVQHGFYVCVLTAKAGQSPVSLVIQRQIQEALGCEAKGKDQANVDLDSIMTDHSDLSSNCLSLARRIRQRAEKRLICLLMDEIHGELLQAIHSIVRLLPHCRLWCTGLWDTNCPANFVHESLKVSVRCPPAVQAVLQLTEPSPNMAAAALTSGATSSTHFGYVTHSTEMDERPLPTTGLRTKLMSHAPHGPGAILDCGQCGEDLAAYLKKELRVGEDLPPGDVLILTADTHNLLLTQESRSSEFMTSLLKAKLEMDIVTHLGHRELAFPAENKITFTTYAFVAGLERKVVVFLPEGSPSADTTERNVSSPEVSCDTDSDDDSISESYLSEKSTTDINTRQNHTAVDSSTSSQTDVTVPKQNCELPTRWNYIYDDGESYYTPRERIEIESLQLAIENSSEDEDDDTDSEEAEATSQTTNVDNLRSFDSRLREAVGQLSVANRERMWYAASRSVAHLVLFHFPEN